MSDKFGIQAWAVSVLSVEDYWQLLPNHQASQLETCRRLELVSSIQFDNGTHVHFHWKRNYTRSKLPFWERHLPKKSLFVVPVLQFLEAWEKHELLALPWFTHIWVKSHIWHLSLSYYWFSLLTSTKHICLKSWNSENFLHWQLTAISTQCSLKAEPIVMYGFLSHSYLIRSGKENQICKELVWQHLKRLYFSNI